MWSQKLLHSSVSFKERRHLLCLKPQSYYCDNDENNLPLSPYTQPFSLGRREEGSEDGGTGDFRAEQDIQPHCALPLHSRPVWTSIPSWSWGGQAARQSIQCHWASSECLTEMLPTQNLKRKELCSLVKPMVVSFIRSKSWRILQRKKNQRKWMVTGKMKKMWLDARSHHESHRRVGRAQYNYISIREICSDHITTGLLYYCAWRQQTQRSRLMLPQRT